MDILYSMDPEPLDKHYICYINNIDSSLKINFYRRKTGMLANSNFCIWFVNGYHVCKLSI